MPGPVCFGRCAASEPSLESERETEREQRGGLASGIERALRVVQRYFGDNVAVQTANYMEYNRSSHRPVG